jgi:hypothetical protein
MLNHVLKYYQWILNESEEAESPDSEYQLLFNGWEERGKEAANYLVKKGYSKVHAAAFIGNFAKESGVRPDVSQSSIKSLKLGTGFKSTTPETAKNQSKKSGYGLAQWTEERKNKLIEAGASTTNAQLDFVISELKDSEKAAWSKIKAETTISGATKAIVTHYERAGVAALADRIKYATSIYNLIK